MSFEAYINNIKTKTGQSPADFHAQAKKLGLVAPGAKATPLVAWLKQEFGLGHGHAMAIWESFKRNGWVERPAAAAAKKRTGRASARR